MSEPIITDDSTSSSVNCVYIENSSLTEITLRNKCSDSMQFTVYFSDAGNFTYHIDARWPHTDGNTERVIKNRNIRLDNYAEILSEERSKCFGADASNVITIDKEDHRSPPARFISNQSSNHVYVVYEIRDQMNLMSGGGKVVIKPQRRLLVSQDTKENIVIICAVFDPD